MEPNEIRWWLAGKEKVYLEITRRVAWLANVLDGMDKRICKFFMTPDQCRKQFERNPGRRNNEFIGADGRCGHF